MTTNPTIRAYLANIGRKGGKASGTAKVRGDADYYKRISKKAVDAKRANAAKNNRQITAKKK